MQGMEIHQIHWSTVLDEPTSRLGASAPYWLGASPGASKPTEMGERRPRYRVEAARGAGISTPLCKLQSWKSFFLLAR